MTDGDRGPGSRPDPVDVSVAGVTVTGLISRTPRPRAVVLALHGGGSRAAYWHGRQPDQSLLRVAADLGFTTVALDLPGYGRSAGQVDGWSLDRRADLVAEAFARVVENAGAGVVVVAHSQGTQLAAHLAARSPLVIGLEFSGSGLEYQDRIRTTPDAAGRDLLKRHMFKAIWGDPALYPGGQLTRDDTRSTPTPPSAYEDATIWPEDLPRTAALIKVPVRMTLAEHEGVWAASPASQARLAELFTASPRVQTVLQHDAPHNISLSSAARAYHLHVLAYAEECVLWARLRALPRHQPVPSTPAQS